MCVYTYVCIYNVVYKVAYGCIMSVRVCVCMYIRVCVICQCSIYHPALFAHDDIFGNLMFTTQDLARLRGFFFLS